MGWATSILGNAQFADSVFLVTDGDDNFRTGKPQQVVESLAARGVRVFVFLVDSGVYKTPEEREAPESMEELARQTGCCPSPALVERVDQQWRGFGEANPACSGLAL